MNVDLQEFRSAFVAEAEEHLASVESLLLVIEPAARAGGTSPREIRTLLRLLHTLKGLSAMVGVDAVVTLAHKMETVLRSVERTGNPIEDRVIEILLASTRAISSRVRAVADERPIAPPPAELLQALDGVEIAAPRSAPEPLPLEASLLAKLSASEQEQLREGTRTGQHALRVDFAPSGEKSAQGISITTVRERAATIAEIVKILPLSVAASAAVPGGLVFALLLLTRASPEIVARKLDLPGSAVVELIAGREPATPVPVAPAFEPLPDEDDHLGDEGRGLLRVEVARIDDAIELLGALVVTRSRMARAVEDLEQRGADTRELRAIMTDNARQLRDLRSAILRVRMIPMTMVLERLPLVVRSLGRTTGKSVRLELDAGAGELDKTVAERLFPALVHLVRNAVDHGIELPAERRAAKKPEIGTIRITSDAGDRLVELRISDDGRGIDAEALAARARKPVPRTDAELLDLVSTPGLSSRSEADTTSGRGLGMDIARQAVVRLGGELGLETIPGRGTTFTVRVPLTVAIVDAFIVRAAGERFAVPVPIVEEIVELGTERIVRGPGETSARLLARRGVAIPLVDLGEVLTLPPVSSPADARATHGLVVRRPAGEIVVFGVDRVLGQQEIVVRPIVDALVSAPSLSGSTDLGDGRATLVLDLVSLDLDRTTRGKKGVAA